VEYIEYWGGIWLGLSAVRVGCIKWTQAKFDRPFVPFSTRKSSHKRTIFALLQYSSGYFISPTFKSQDAQGSLIEEDSRVCKNQFATILLKLVQHSTIQPSFSPTSTRDLLIPP
jgi:hypothetical protein